MLAMMTPVLALLLALAAPPIWAQEPSSPPPADAPGAAVVGPGGAVSAEAASERARRLDELLGRLADPAASDPRTLQREIGQLWASSGSDAMDLLLSRSREAIDEQDLDRAIEHLDALMELAPDFAEGYATRATAQFLKDEFWNAVIDIQRTLALEPRHFGALAGLATMLERTGDEAGALAAMREALRLNPHLEAAREAVDRLAPKVDGRDI